MLSRPSGRSGINNLALWSQLANRLMFRPVSVKSLCLAACVAVAMVAATGGADVHARPSSPAASASRQSGVSGSQAGQDALQDIRLADLPVDARNTYRLILAGGPFASEHDGVVFGNRERILPRKPRGYYHEYTVPTPGARTRGARRVVCGGQAPSRPEVCYYTNDHYANFRRITDSHAVIVQ
jgi:ribonuclease T1